MKIQVQGISQLYDGCSPMLLRFLRRKVMSGTATIVSRRVAYYCARLLCPVTIVPYKKMTNDAYVTKLQIK